MASTRILVVVALLGLGSTAFAQSDQDLRSVIFEPRPILADDPLLDSVVRGPGDEETIALDEWLEDEDAREDRLVDAIEVRLASISDIEALEGENSTSLIPDLVALGALHQELGEHLAAIEAFERAIQISRIHYGLYVLDQAAIIQQMNDSIAAIGQYEEAEAHHRDVLELTWRNTRDPRSAFIYKDIADRQMNTVDSFLAGDFPEITIVERVSSNSVMEVRGRDSRSLAIEALRGARRSYFDAIRASLGNGAFDVPGLMELQENIIETYYLEVTSPKLRRYGPGRRASGRIYVQGASVLAARIQNASRFEGPEAVTLAMIELADWHLRFSRNGKAIDEYRLAYEYLSEQGASAASIDAIFSPEVPVSVPVVPSDPDSVYRGYFDVALELGRFGTTQNVQVLDSYPRASRAIERRLRRHVAQSRFRPPFVEGEPARSYAFALRYYWSY